MSWLVYRLTQSTFALGAVAFVTEISGVAVALVGGLVADRLSVHRIVLATQSLAMVQALLLAGLTFTGRIDLAAIIVLSCLLGIGNGFDVPARQVFVLQLVERREHLANAIVLSSVALDGARLVGPPLGGAIVAGVGEWLCFLLNAVSYAAVIGALLAMKLPPRPRAHAGATLGAGLREGIRYAWGFAPIRLVLMLVALASFAGGPYAVLMPVMAADVLGGGPYTLGLLMASIGLGALAGAMYLGRRRPGSGYDRLIGVGAGLFGASLVLFSLSRWLVLSVPLLVVAGFGVMILMASSHTTLLMVADEDKRGRVMSLFTLSFMATVPFGSLLAGSLAGVAGAPGVLAAGGGICVAGALAFSALRRAAGTTSPASCR